MHAFLSNLANRQTDKQTNRQTDKRTRANAFTSYVGGKLEIKMYHLQGSAIPAAHVQFNALSLKTIKRVLLRDIALAYMVDVSDYSSFSEFKRRLL